MALENRNVTVAGRRTSIRLEPDMWHALAEICERENVSLHQVCTRVASGRLCLSSLTAAVRVFILNYYRFAATEQGHQMAGHGRRSDSPLWDAVL